MKQKKGELSPNYHKYSIRISNHDKIEDLASIIKEFLRNTFHIKYEYTFEEINDLVDKKHIPAEIKPLLSTSFRLFSYLEYRQKKPTKKEISNLKKILKEIIKNACPKKTEEKKLLFFGAVIKKTEEVRRKKQKQEDIVKKVEKVKENIEKNIIKKVKEEKAEKKPNIQDDKEDKEIARFVVTSLKIGMTLPDIKKELRELSFPGNKVNAVTKDMLRKEE